MSEPKKPKTPLTLSLPPKPEADPTVRAKPRLRSGVTRSTARRSRPAEPMPAEAAPRTEQSPTSVRPSTPRSKPAEGFAGRGKPRSTGAGSFDKTRSASAGGAGKFTRPRPAEDGARFSRSRTADGADKFSKPREKAADGTFTRAPSPDGEKKFTRARATEERRPFAKAPAAEAPRKFTRSRPVERAGGIERKRPAEEAGSAGKFAKGPPRAATSRATEDAKPRVTRRSTTSSQESVQRSAPPPPTQRKVPDDGKVRVSKLLSERGLCSRREADEFIERGWVSVDGVVVTELGTRVNPDQEVTLDRNAKAAQLRSVTFLLNKPVGYVSAQPEPGKKPAMSLLLPENRWDDDEWGQRFQPFHLRGLAPAGRLDIDSTGLIVFTQDGRVARRLIGEDSNVEKEYLVRVEGQIQDNGLKLLNHGLSLDGEKLKPAKVSWQNEDQLRFVLREGKKRQIRRMCEMVGLTVVGLKRIRIGSVVLGKLPVGKWRYLRDDERF